MGEDVQQMKTARERLLTLFDRTGWEARTQRGFRDGVSNRRFDNIPIGKRKELSRTQRRQELNKRRSPRETSENAPWILDARPRYRGKSRIRDKIRFFDGVIEFSPSGYQGLWNLYGADVAAPSQSPTKYQQVVPSTKLGPYPVLPPKHQNGTATPIKSYGYLRPQAITPLPWRPLDSRRWERVAHLINDPRTPNTRGRPGERVQHSLITLTPTSAASAVKEMQITHQDPKRNISEMISALRATRLKEKEQDEFNGEIQENEISSALVPFTQALSSFKTAQRQGANDDSHVETKGILKSDGAMSVEGSKPAKESKIQDRIKMFSNQGADVKSFGLPLTRMRNQPAPAKLSSQAADRAPRSTSSRVPQPNRSTRPQVEKRSTEVIVVAATDNVASDTLLETEADQQRSKPMNQELEIQAPAPRKLSPISDKIQYFEAFAGGQAASIGRAVMDDHRKWSLPQSKRIQRWPQPASENIFKRKTEQTEVLVNSIQRQQIRQEIEEIVDSAAPNSTEMQRDEAIKRHQDRERARYKIRSQRERLNSRSLSRSPSVPSISTSGLPDERGSDREAFKQPSECFREKRARQRKKQGKVSRWSFREHWIQTAMRSALDTIPYRIFGLVEVKTAFQIGLWLWIQWSHSAGWQSSDE